MKHLLAKLVAGASLERDEAVEVFEAIMTGRASAAQVGAVLALLQARGPSVDEIVGAASVMRDKVTRVDVPEGLLAVDTCGTGGLHRGTLNISTAAAIVVAGAARPHGVCVAKHGNKAVTSKSGSAQVLEALGVKLAAAPGALTRCLDEAGICFCFAPAHHPAMKHAAPIRQELGVRTIFNMIGPLTNPAGARRQVMGVFDPALTPTVAEVLGELGAEQAMVVHGQLGIGGGIDELSVCGPSRVSHLRDGRVTTADLEPETLGLSRADPTELAADGPEASAKAVRGVLAGKPGPMRDIVCLNAAAALVVTDLAADLRQGLERAAEAIDTGAAAAALEKLVAITSDDA